MNKIYKVMYSKVKQCAVVVSEIAKSHGHNGESSGVRKHAALTAAVLIALGSLSFTTAFVPMTAEAADKTRTDGSDFVGVERTDGLFEDSDYANYKGQGAHGADSITIGLKASGSDGTITIGDRRAEKSLGSVYVGRGPGMPTGKVLPSETDNGYWATSVGYQSDATGYGSIAIGSNATANNSYDKDSTGHGIILRTPSGDGKSVVLNGKPDIQRASVAIGYGASADNGNIAIGSYSDASTDLRTAKTKDGKEIKSYLTDKMADSYVSVGDGKDHSETQYRRISNVADGAADSDAATIAQLKEAVKETDASKKANIDASNIGSKLKKADGKTPADSSDITTNEDAWGEAIGTGKVEKTNGQLVTGGTVYNALQQQKTDLTNDLSVNAGWGINVADEKDPKTGEVTKKNVISLNRNLGTNLDKTGHVYLDVSKTGLVLGTVVDGAPGTDMDLHYGATGDYAVTVGGGANTASGKASAVLGGSLNQASNEATVASGGSSNVASGSMAAVYGGYDNEASGAYATILGGAQNKASNTWTAVGGGALNEASGKYASIWGGYHNEATDDSAAVYGGLGNSAYGSYSAILGGGSNKAGVAAVVSGGASNEAAGLESAVLGGEGNIVTGANATAVGGVKGSVNGVASVGILGGSTGINAPLTLAAGYQSTVTDTGVTSTPITEKEVEKFTEEGTHPGLIVGSGDLNNPTFKILDHFATAVGYQATADEAQTVAFGHDKGDTYYGTTTYTWKQKATFKDGHYYDEYNQEISKESYESLKNADGTWNDYRQPIATVEEKKYDSAYYNRLVKVADGIDDHDVVVMEQLKQYAEKDASNTGSNLKTYTVGDDGKTITEADATAEQKKANKDAWGKALGAEPFTAGTDTTATNASTSDQLVTGKTLYDYDKPTGSTNYVKANNTTGQNLSALDAQVKANADTLNDKTHNIKYYSVNDKNSITQNTLPTVTGLLADNSDNKGAKGMGSLASGFSTEADGTLSTVGGSYSGVINEGSVPYLFGVDIRGTAAVSYGTGNINKSTAQSEKTSGVANSLIGQVNDVTDSNAAIAIGAGNTISNSYRDVTISLGKVLKYRHDPEALRTLMKDAVKESGGQVMVMGGGNNVESAYMSQVVGVGNTVKGNQVESKGEWVTDTSNTAIKYDPKKSSQYNYVDGFSNEVINGKHDYVIGANNKLSGDSYDDDQANPIKRSNKSNIVIGDNHTLTRKQNTVIIGSSDTENTQTIAHDAVIIGHNANATSATGADNAVAIGLSATATGGNAVTIGVNTSAGDNSITIGSQSSAISGQNIAIGRYAKVDGYKVTKAVALGQKAEAQVTDGVAIGSNSIATVAGNSVEGYDPTTGRTSTDPTATWKATKAAVSIGTADGKVTRQINGVAAGTNDTDAVNVAQIKKLASINASNIGANLQYGADGTTAAADTDKTKNKEAWATAIGTGTVTKEDDGSKQMVTGKTVYDALHGGLDNITVGKDGQNGKDGSIGIAGQNGKDGYSMTIIKTEQGAAGVDGKDGITRVVYQDKDGNGKHTFATLDDGLKFKGDDSTVIAKKLNEQLNITGGADSTKLTDKNIGVNSSTDGLKIQLAKNLAGITSIANQTTTGKGDAQTTTGAKIDLKDDGSISVNSGKITDVKSGLTATDGTYADTDKNNAANIGDVHSMIEKEAGNTDDKLALKANVAADNIGTHITDTTAQKTNLDNWGEAIGTGKIADPDASDKETNGSKQLVTGGTVYNEVRPSKDGKYVKIAQTTGANLIALDDQVKQNAQNISDNTYAQGDGILMDKTKKTISVNKGDGLKFTEDHKLAVYTGNGLKIDNGAVAIKTSDSNLKVDSNGIGLSDKITIGSDKTKQVTIDGTKGEISGLTNTTWDSKADYSKSTKAATESQVDAAVKDAVKQAGDNDTHVEAGSYAVDNQHQISMNLVDKNNVTKGTVIITDVAKSSEMGDVSKLADGVKNAGGKTTTVVDAINNVNTSMNTKIGDQKYSTSNTSGTNKYVIDGDSITSAIGKLDGAVQQATTAAGQHSTVSAGSNITVTPAKQTDGHTDYQVALNKDITVDSVTAKTATTDTLTVNNSATIGGVTIANKTISGLDDTKIEKGSTNAVNAGTIWNELRPSGGTYINQNNTTAQNITNLDTQVKKNSDLVNSDGSTIKIGSKDSATKVDISDKNGSGRVVTGVVTDASDPTSAANVGYVNGVTAANTQQIYRDMNNAYGRLNNNINKAAAGSNALAALHPLDYDPDDKADFAVGYGHYRNANAAALGAFYHPNENTMVNVGVSLGNGDPGFNAGVSFKVGRGGAGRKVMSRTEMAKVINSQSKEIDALKKDNADKDKRIDALEQKMAEILAKLDKNGK